MQETRFPFSTWKNILFGFSTYSTSGNRDSNGICDSATVTTAYSFTSSLVEVASALIASSEPEYFTISSHSRSIGS